MQDEQATNRLSTRSGISHWSFSLISARSKEIEKTETNAFQYHIRYLGQIALMHTVVGKYPGGTGTALCLALGGYMVAPFQLWAKWHNINHTKSTQGQLL